MFPSFPCYKEGTGGRGQIEPGPPVILHAVNSPIYGGGGGNYRYVGETSDASSITTTEYYKKILQLILTLAFPCTFNKYFMFINNDIAQAYVTILIQGLNDFILLRMF